MAGLTETEYLHVMLHAFYWRLHCRAFGIDGREERATANSDVNKLLLAVANSDETIVEGVADYLTDSPLPQTGDPATDAAYRKHFQKSASELIAFDRQTAGEIVSSLRKLDPRI